MSTLKEKARQAAAESWGDIPPGEVAAHTIDPPPPAVQEAAVPLQPIVELTEPTSADPEQVPVVVAWARVMRDVMGIGKNSLYNQSGTRYNFRGVDATVNAFGPACRRHGVIVLPHKVEPSHAPATSSKGSAMRETTTIVHWRIYGPKGDFLDAQSEGESLDVGDKGTAKAQSVALRVFLLAAGLVPTDEKDPDAQHIERGDRPTPRAADYVEEICNPKTSLRRLLTIKGEVERFNLGPHEVTGPTGDREPLGRLLWRIGKEREEEQQRIAVPGGEG